MSIVDEIKRYQIKRLGSQNVLEPGYVGFEQAHHFGLFFQKPGLEEPVMHLKQWLEEHDKEVHLLAFLPVKRKDIKNLPENHDWFCKNHLNWYRKPGGEAVYNFLKVQYDVFIDFSLENRSVNLFINHLVHTRFRIGSAHKPAEDYDLQMDLQKSGLQELKYYLQFINRKENETV